MRHQRLLKKFLIIIKKLENFHRASKVDKRTFKLKIEESIAERTKLRRQKLNIIAKKKKNIDNDLFNKYFNYPSPDIKIKRLKDVGDEKNKNMVKSINKTLNKMKENIKDVPENKTFKIEENKKIIDIAEEILELNKEKHSAKVLKTLTPEQMLSRLPITLAQLKAGKNSGKLKNEIRRFFYSLYRSKKLTK